MQENRQVIIFFIVCLRTHRVVQYYIARDFTRRKRRKIFALRIRQLITIHSHWQLKENISSQNLIFFTCLTSFHFEMDEKKPSHIIQIYHINVNRIETLIKHISILQLCTHGHIFNVINFDTYLHTCNLGKSSHLSFMY